MPRRNRSESVLKVAKECAREVLLDQTRFELPEAQHQRFMQVLDKPLPKASRAALKRLLARRPAWEK